MEAGAQRTTTTPGANGRVATPPPGTRTSDEIRSNVVTQREELARSVDALRVRWSEATDVKSQIQKHKTELLIGAAVVGFGIGVALALGRRRRR
jgi:hypothetical protein